MRILVTGGCGFIGSHIVDILQSKGHDVLSVDNLSFGKKSRIKAPNRRIDITKTDSLLRVFKSFKPEVVVHTAAHTMARESITNPFFDAHTNIFGTLSVLECARKTGGVKKVIYTATGGACYGEPEVLPAPENAPALPLSPYGASKYSAEKYVHLYSKMYGFDHLIFRFGNVYGPRDDPATKRVIAVFADALLKGKKFQVFGDGKQTRDFLYVMDIAKMVGKYVNRKTPSHIYNLASGVGVSVNEIYAIIVKNLGIDRKPEYVDAVKGEVRDITLDISKAVKELKWKPTSFEKGMKETIAWFKEQY